MFRLQSLYIYLNKDALEISGTMYDTMVCHQQLTLLPPIYINLYSKKLTQAHDGFTCSGIILFFVINR